MIGGFVKRLGLGFVASAAVFFAVGMTVAPEPAHAVSTGEAVGIGLGAFALGSALSAPYGYPGYGAYPTYPAYYYPPAPPAYYYPPPRSCWNPYYGRYYPC